MFKGKSKVSSSYRVLSVIPGTDRLGRYKVESKLLGIELELSSKHPPTITNIVHSSPVALSGAVAIGEQVRTQCFLLLPLARG